VTGNEARCHIWHYYQCDEVTDISNWEQLGIVIWYVKEHKPVEWLLEIVSCEKIAGKDLCDNLTKSLQTVKLYMYPNITTIIHILLLTSVTACSVERANSSLRFVKLCFRSTMNEDRFNGLIFIVCPQGHQVRHWWHYQCLRQKAYKENDPA
jgi:hypothetical protein